MKNTVQSAIYLLFVLGAGCQPALKTESSYYPSNPATPSLPEGPSESQESPKNKESASIGDPKKGDVIQQNPTQQRPRAIGKGFRNTYYYLVEETDYSPKDPRDQEVLDPFGNVIALVSAKFKKDLLMEGSGKLLDGRVINYHGKVDETYRFHITTHPMGRGSGNCALVPFKSIAVDPSQIPIGSEVFIDQTVGMILPDGSIHDGVWYAYDTGGAILHDRVDIFVGVRRDAKALSLHGITHMEPLTIRVLKEPDLFSCVFESPL
jgi:3D (Asp-Asp-Asp) domain-containing protein